MPMYQLQEEMTYSEFLDWIEYFKRRPQGWRDDQRTSMIVRSMGAKVEPEQLFPSLDRVYSEARATEQYHINKAKRSAFLKRFMPDLVERS